jgi:hypothetical protein
MSGLNGLLNLGYDLDAWKSYGGKYPITVDTSPHINSHILLCGMSGSGKSFLQEQLFCKLKLANPQGEFFFADYKQDDSFSHLRQCPLYFCYSKTLEALEAVHSRLYARMSGEDESRHPITLVWDEYMANILALINADKKRAGEVMNKVSEILLMGRSMAVRLVTSMQRPDAIAFPAGSRLNYGVVIVLGAAVNSIYEMLMPDFMNAIKDRTFGVGEGVCLLQGSELRYIKVGRLSDSDRDAMRSVCIEALS